MADLTPDKTGQLRTFVRGQNRTDTDISPLGDVLSCPGADGWSLRDRLIRLRDALLARLAADPIVDAGLLAMLADCLIVLAALDAMAGPDDAEPGTRVVVTDDGTVIRVAIYSDAGALAAVEVEPRRALGLAVDLLEAAMRHER